MALIFFASFSRLFVFFSILLLFSITTGHADNIATRWARIKTPTHIGGDAQSIGTYTAGCVSGAVALPENGIGYQVMRLSRNRFYGHPDLKQFIENLGLAAYKNKLGTLLIGDLGQPRGGPTLTGHRSHQTGLDVDIWFLLSPQAANRTLNYSEREQWGAPSVLVNHSGYLDFSNWSENNEKILELTSRTPEVDRIFVHPSVKRQLCQKKANRSWLRKIRPWWKHDDHFHVRLKCPNNNKYCQGQDPLPLGDGCDASLDWWFSEEAKSPKARKETVKPLQLPFLCQQVLEN